LRAQFSARRIFVATNLGSGAAGTFQIVGQLACLHAGGNAGDDLRSATLQQTYTGAPLHAGGSSAAHRGFERGLPG